MAAKATLFLLLTAFAPVEPAPLPGGWSKEIAPGVFMPYVSLGHPDDNSSTAADVEMWLRLGGVGLDTAWNYVGAAAAA